MIVVHSQGTCRLLHISVFSGVEYRIVTLVGVSSVSFGAVYITINSVISFHHSLNSFVELGEVSCFGTVSNWQKRSCRKTARLSRGGNSAGVFRVVVALQTIWGAGLGLLGRVFLSRQVYRQHLSVRSGFKVREEMVLTLWEQARLEMRLRPARVPIRCSLRERTFSAPLGQCWDHS